jgi:hypothetical protein
MAGNAALIRHVRHPDAEHAAQQLGVEMMECADAAGAIVQPPLIGELHKVRDAVHRQRRVNHQNKRNTGDERDRHQVPIRLVRQLLEDGGVH